MIAAGVFIAYQTGRSGVGARDDPAWASAVALQEGKIGAAATVDGRVGAPYLAGLLALREGPLLEKAVRSLPTTPDVVLVNATGLDHPRGAGLAVHLGAVLDLPTVGITDRALLATGDEPARERGARSPLTIGGDLVGFRLRTRNDVRPLFVHAGWRTDPPIACAIVLEVTARSRTPEPLRAARQLARTARSASLPPGHAFS